MLGKISLRNISSYAFASARFVHPCQRRAIMCQCFSCSCPFLVIVILLGFLEVRSRARVGTRTRTRSHAHYLVAAIDVNYLASDRRGSVAGEENSGGAQLSWIATAFQRRALLIMFKHRAETTDAAGGQRLNWSCGNTVHPDFFRTKIVGKIASAGFKACFGHAHHVVVWH